MDLTAIARRYYAAFTDGSGFDDVPFDDAVAFRGPTGEIEGAPALRGVLEGLAQNVKSVEIRHQLAGGDQVVTVYDFDLGAADGPIPMAERLGFADGRIREIELLFDAQRLAGASPAAEEGHAS